MSTYLVACIIGKFSYVSAISKMGVEVRGYTSVGLENKVLNFVQLAADSVDFYSDYFGIPYPLPKLDLVSLHKMNVRAMENWGCITFLNEVLLTSIEDNSAELV